MRPTLFTPFCARGRKACGRFFVPPTFVPARFAVCHSLPPQGGLPPAFGRPCGGRVVPPTFVPVRYRGLSLTAPRGGCRPPLGVHAAGGLCPPRSRQPRCARLSLTAPQRGLPPAFGRPCGGRFVPPRSCQPASRSVTLCSTSPLKRLPTPAGKAMLCLSASVPYGGDAVCRGAIHCALMGYIQGRGMKRGTMDAPQPVDALPPSPPAAAPPRRRPLGRLDRKSVV